MRKMFMIFAVFICIISFVSVTKADGNDLFFADLTTTNFHTRSNELDFHSIKKLCSYDYCDYRQGESMKEALEIFTENYLSTIDDEETRASLKIKGIRITKIVLFNEVK